MAIHDKGKSQQAGQEQSQQQNTGYQEQAQQNAGYQQTAQPQQPQQGPAGFGAMNQLFRRSGSYDRSEGRSAEALRALTDASKEAINSQQLSDDFELIRFDRDQHRVGLSAILVAKSVKVQGKMYSIVRTLILDTEGVRLPPRVVQYGSQRIETPTRPQDVFNDIYLARLTEFMQRNKGITEMQVVDAGPLVIPREFDFTEVDLVARLLVTSVNRVDDVVAMLMGEQPLNVSAIKRNDERLTARVDFTGEPSYDITGMPVRNDIQVSLNRQVNNNQAQEDFYEVETHFNSVSGFVNLEYTGAQQQQPQMGWGQPQQPQPLFTPSFVITSVDQADWIQAQTFELYLLAISNAFRVTAGTAWAQTFRPQVGKAGIDMKDIGALGYKTQSMKKFETKSDSFTDQEFADMMSMLVQPNPVFMLDVNPVGDHASIENYFLDAAGDGPNRNKAVSRLIQAADNLTGGRFSAHFPHDRPIVVPSNMEVHLGYYIGEDGEKRDIRDLDVLAMLNLTQGDMQTFNQWYATYCDPSRPFELRMQQREQLERQFLSKGLRITGRAVRLILTAEFIQALDKATHEAGLHVDFESMTTVIGGQRFAGNTMVGQYAVSGAASMGYGGGQTYSGGPSYGGVTGGGRLY